MIDGYALLHDCSAAAVDVATEIAMDAGVPVSFDLVPHTIDRRLPAGRIEPFLDRASIRIAEAPTLAGFSACNHHPNRPPGMPPSWSSACPAGTTDQLRPVSSGTDTR